VLVVGIPPALGRRAADGGCCSRPLRCPFWLVKYGPGTCLGLRLGPSAPALAAAVALRGSIGRSRARWPASPASHSAGRESRVSFASGRPRRHHRADARARAASPLSSFYEHARRTWGPGRGRSTNRSVTMGRAGRRFSRSTGSLLRFLREEERDPPSRLDCAAKALRAPLEQPRRANRNRVRRRVERRADSMAPQPWSCMTPYSLAERTCGMRVGEQRLPPVALDDDASGS